MKVLLLADVAGLGVAGEVVRATDGHAGNHLLPQGLAVRATSDKIARREALLAQRADRAAATVSLRGEAHRAIAALPGPLRVAGKAGPGGRLFGAVNRRVLAEAILEGTGQTIERGAINLPEPIKSVGLHHIEVALPGLEPLSVAVQVEG